MFKPKIKTFSTTVFLLIFFLNLGFSFFNPQSVRAAARCFNFDGTVEKACETLPNYQFQDNKCYTEVRQGPNGTLVGYNETSCSDATDRNQDGTGLNEELEGDCTVPLSAVNHNDQDTSNDCGIIAYIVLFTNILSALVGVIAVIMLVIWGIQYSAARDNPQAVSQAKTRILWTVVAIAVYLFFYIFLQWLVPGGIF